MAVRVSVHTQTLSALRFSWAQVPGPQFLDFASPQKPLLKIVLTLGGDVNGNKMKD